MKRVLLATAVAAAHSGAVAYDHCVIGRGFSTPFMYFDVVACSPGIANAVWHKIRFRSISKQHKKLLKSYVHPKDIKLINSKRKLLIQAIRTGKVKWEL